MIIAAQGFQTLTQEHVVVDALATVSLSLQMTIGSSTEHITVTESPTMLHTDDSTLGGTMENNVYTSLPLAMNGVPRDPTQFLALIPGVSGMSTQVAGPTTESFNGIRGDNELAVEGLPLTFPAGQSGYTQPGAWSFGGSRGSVSRPRPMARRRCIRAWERPTSC